MADVKLAEIFVHRLDFIMRYERIARLEFLGRCIGVFIPVVILAIVIGFCLPVRSSSSSFATSPENTHQVGDGGSGLLATKIATDVERETPHRKGASGALQALVWSLSLVSVFAVILFAGIPRCRDLSLPPATALVLLVPFAGVLGALAMMLIPSRTAQCKSKEA